MGRAIMIEQWKDINGFEGVYQISTHGRIKRFWVSASCGYKILNPWVDKRTGYKRIDLCVKCKKDFRRIHQLVLEAFVGPRGHKMEGRHLDGNRQNNHLSNLQWGTRSENQQDRKRHGTTNRGTGNAKLTIDQVSRIRRLLRSGRNGHNGPKYSHSIIAAMFGVKSCTITDIKTRKTWGCVG